MVHIAGVGDQPLGHVRAAQHDALFIEYLDDVPVPDPALFRLAGVHPAGLVLITVLAADLHGLHFAVPDDVVALRVHPPAAVVRHAQQRVLLCTFAGERLVVRAALLDPFGIGRTFLVVREVLFESGGGKLK